MVKYHEKLPVAPLAAICKTASKEALRASFRIVLSQSYKTRRRKPSDAASKERFTGKQKKTESDAERRSP